MRRRTREKNPSNLVYWLRPTKRERAFCLKHGIRLIPGWRGRMERKRDAIAAARGQA